MKVTTCVPDPTSASGGPSAESVALQEIVAQLGQINGNSDLVESLQAASNAALTNLAGYVDGLETMVTSLNSQTDGLEALMANLGINTDGIEGQLGDIKLSLANIEQWKNLDLRQGWVQPAGYSFRVPALIHFGFSLIGVPSGLNSGTNTTVRSYYTHPGTGDITYGVVGGAFNINWGVGEVPAVPVVNIPGSFNVVGVAVTSMPVGSVKSVTLVSTTGAVKYSTDSGATSTTIASGSRTWTAQPGASLNVSAMQFEGTLATSTYDVIYEA